MQLVGVDTGGTFTDAVVVRNDGTIGVGKALSTPGALERGVVASIAVAAADAGLTLENALAGADFVAHGTTAGLNALLTQTGARVGLLTTRGFEATVPMARANTVRGINETEKTEAVRWSKPALLMSRRLIRGVAERIDADGAVVLPLDETQARAAIAELAEACVDAIAISLLWAPANPAHEQRLRQLVLERLPGVSVTLASELAPRIGEYERTMTAVLNAYVAPLLAAYTRRLEDELRRRGFAGTLLLTKNSGGVQRATSLDGRSVETLNSGPVGGLVATAALGALLGHQRVVATDVGGTSFDVGLVVNGRPRMAARPLIGRYDVATPVVDIVSIGTGGGSIAWLDAELGALRVGPASAGAEPGPVCYGRGGAAPTVTDAAVVLGYLDRVGSSPLDMSAATTVIEQAIGAPLGLEVHEAAEGILEVASAQMADLVRRATIMRGHDPADFVLYAYGGAAPQYVGRYARQIGVLAAFVPELAAVFSAFGAVSGDFRVSVTRDLGPHALLSALDATRETLRELEREARVDLDAGAAASGVRIQRRAGLRFARQVNELQIELSPGALDERAAQAVISAFRDTYERLVGAGTALSDAPVELVNLSVDAFLRLAPPTPARRAKGATVAEADGEREAWFDRKPWTCPVYLARALPTGAPVAGPAFIELPTTTIVVYPGQQATRDAAGNVRLDLGEQR
jgi:N-methylhydantoinase A